MPITLSIMKKQLVTYILFAIVFPLMTSPLVSGQRITVLGNSIDLPLVSGYLDTYMAAGVDVQTISANELPAHKNDPVIMILGGQNSPEGVGEIVGGILNPNEKNDVLSSPNSEVFAIAANLWAAKQKVIVFAGYGKEQTRRLFAGAQADILKSMRFNDSAFAVNYTDTSATVPLLDGTQPFTDVDAYEANSIIRGISGVLIVDVRGAPFYDAGHIPNAKNIHGRELYTQVDSMDKDVTYLLYCGGNSESIAAGNLMYQKGFKKVYRLVDGYIAWRRAGFPKEKTG